MYFFAYKHQEQSAIGLSTEEGLFDFSLALDIYQRSQGNSNPVPVHFLQLLVEMGFCSKEAADEVMDSAWVKAKRGDIRVPKGYQLQIPIERPGKVIGIGRNYTAHAEELNHNIPDEPIFFAKSSSSLITHEHPIQIPSWIKGRVDHEAELGIIIGRPGKNIHENEALSHVAGYTAINDVTARAMQAADMKASNPWFRSKAIDTFCPIGPGITPADSISDPQDLDIQLTVNGEIRQSSNTGKMIFPISRIISELSKYMTLQPGDIIASGTPEGVGPIHHGDLVKISISGLGELENPVESL